MQFCKTVSPYFAEEVFNEESINLPYKAGFDEGSFFWKWGEV